MSSKLLKAAAGAALLLSGCHPKPIDIDIPQKPGAISISSACPNAHTVYVTASYSINSLMTALDTAALGDLADIPKKMLIDSAIVTLRGNGATPDTLRKIAPGLYGRKDLQLQPGRQYTLTVLDYRKGIAAIASTTYLPGPVIDTLCPEHIITATDTITKLRIQMRDVAKDSYYFVCYNTVRNAQDHAIPLPLNSHALNFFTPKQIALFTGEESADGRLDKAVTLQVAPTDTVLVQVGSIDKAYYDYLAAYKRTGALINQLTGEPINLPSNVSGGFGYFSLYHPQRLIYDLSRR